MISFDHNIRAFERQLSGLAQRQLPFATSLALNDTADTIKRNAERSLDRDLDRPTPFTKRGLMVLRSSRRRLEATVLFKDRQASYLAWQEEGGTRRPLRRAIPVPVGVRLNRYGNMTRGRVRALLARRDVFSGNPTGRAGGIYQRTGKGGRKLRLLVAWEGSATYRPRLNFRRSAERTAVHYFPIALDRAMRRALATARR